MNWDEAGLLFEICSMTSGCKLASLLSTGPVLSDLKVELRMTLTVAIIKTEKIALGFIKFSITMTIVMRKCLLELISVVDVLVHNTL